MRRRWPSCSSAAPSRISSSAAPVFQSFGARATGFYELRRQLEYKAARRAGRVVVADRWYPSSKLCSCCGYRVEVLGLGVRQWTCPGCSTLHDRDVNAAINLKNMALSSIATACGGEGAGLARERKAKPAPVKQESNGRQL